MLMDRESAFKKLFIGFKKGRNSKEKKNNTKANKRYLARPLSGLRKFFQKFDIIKYYQIRLIYI